MSIRDAISLNGQPLPSADLVADTFWDWQPVDIACQPQPNVRAVHLVIGEAALGPPLVAFGDPTWRWRWQPREAVGVFDAELVLTLADGTQSEERFRIRIRPRTIDSEQYEALIMAVQHDVAALVYALQGGTEGVRMVRAGRARSLLEEYALLVEQLGPQAVEVASQITKQPHQHWRMQRDTLSLGEITRFDAATAAAIAQAAPAAVDQVNTPQFNGTLPQTVSLTQTVLTTDSLEHRLLKGVLQQLHARSMVLYRALQHEHARRAQHDAVRDTPTVPAMQQRMQRCARLQRALRQALADRLLAGITPLVRMREPTHLMRHAPRYRRVYALYRALRNTLLLDWDSPLLWLPIQALPVLYEQWCVLQVLHALRDMGTVEGQQVLVQAGTGEQDCWTLRLNHNIPLLTVRQDDGTLLRLFYQRRYVPQAAGLGSLDPFVRIPDIAIEVTRAGQVPQVLLLDAKYRVSPDGGVPQDALDDAYAYRTAIGVNGQRTTLGAFLLYPGSKHIVAADNVGALPLLPTSSNELARMLTAICV